MADSDDTATEGHDPVATPNQEEDDAERVVRTDVGVSITSTLKRGSGTRDQDKHVLKAKGENLQDAVRRHRAGMEYLEEEAADRARKLQPGAEEEEGADE